MYQRSVLDNGLPVLTSSMPHTRSVTMALFIGAGSRYESEEIAGVSHFLEHLLFKGTKNWPRNILG
jgi:predicted Zn-dependent peptidase